MYSTPTCAPCAQAKRWFDDHGVAFTEHDVSRDPVRATELYRLTGQGAVPVIRVGAQVLVGFDPLQLAKLIPTATSGARDNGGGVKLSLGMAAQSLTSEKATELGLPAPFGVIVGPVRPGGPAEAAGLQEGDVITGIGDYTLQNLAQLQAAVAAKAPGDSITLRVARGDSEIQVTVTFPAPEPAPAADPSEAPELPAEPPAGAASPDLN